MSGEIPLEMYVSEERIVDSSRFAKWKDLILGENKCATLS